jgi:hypothetical protein
LADFACTLPLFFPAGLRGLPNGIPPLIIKITRFSEVGCHRSQSAHQIPFE